MDLKTFIGGSPLGVAIRLIILSLVVGIVLSAMGVRPDTLFYHLNILARRIYDLGFGAFEWALNYLLLGAMVVVPIWLLARVFGAASGRDKPPPPNDVPRRGNDDDRI